MLRPEYIEALETRLRWLKWAQSDAGWREAIGPLDARHIFPRYRQVLEHGELYCMVPHFAALVDQARRDVPDDLEFDRTWLQSPSGFVYIPDAIMDREGRSIGGPFEVPPLDKDLLEKSGEGDPLVYDYDRGQLIKRRFADVKAVRVRAIAWEPVPPGTRLWDDFSQTHMSEVSGEGWIQILCFNDLEDGRKFNPWSYFTVKDGDRLGNKVQQFEDSQQHGRYVRQLDSINPQRPADPLHEIRWAFTALHLMAQRLTVERRHTLDRATRRRMERADDKPAPPFIRVITLRRLEQDRREAGPAGEAPDWQWSWIVSGHWRWQWYESLGVHKRIFIESFLKGPPEKPLKPGGMKLFGVSR